MSQVQVQVQDVQDKLDRVNRTKLAKELGVTRTHVSLVLSGKSVPSLPIAARIADRTGVTLDQLWEHLCGQLVQ